MKRDVEEVHTLLKTELSDEEPIPFNRPCLVGNEMDYVRQAIESGHSACGGPFSTRVSRYLEEVIAAPGVLLTTSCTDALEMTAMMLQIQPGDVVIVPSFTFTSTALAFAREGATLRFADIDPVTLCLDPDDVQQLLDERVRAIVTVHYAGVPSPVEELTALAASVGACLIEDNAHGLFGTHLGRPLGSFGRFSTLSFHETKNFICGEGGALVLNDEADIERAHVLLDKGTNRQQFLDGLADKYTWQALGSSFGLSDILAAFLAAQLERADHVRQQRRRVATMYRKLLEPLAEELGIGLPYEPATAEPADHMFYVLLTDPTQRGDLITSMRSQGVSPTFHYVPLHSSPAGVALTDRSRVLEVTDDTSRRLLRLPFYNDLQDTQIHRVVDCLTRSLKSLR